jgi:cobalt-zinc-cadmium efflux system outer membrane protein
MAYPLDTAASVDEAPPSSRGAETTGAVTGPTADGSVARQPDSPELLPAPHPEPVQAPPVRPEPLQAPPELPGADAPPLHLPPYRPDTPNAERREAIRSLYSPLPQTPGFPAWQPDFAGRTLTLEALQDLALANSPVLRQAAADVETARGAMIQAGTYPNPEIGYEGDTVGTWDTNGYQGGYVQQNIVTAGKLRLAQSAAGVDLANAQVAMRRARVDVATAVRRAYFAVLVARERLQLAQALAQFTERVYRTQVQLVEGGESAPYEPMQLRVLTLQAQAAVVRAQCECHSQWRQLAAAIGLPDLPPTQVPGRPDMPVPAVDYEQALTTMLANHTDLSTAANKVRQARTLLRLAQVKPIPNVDVTVAVQHDYTFIPGTTTYNLQVGGQLPVFDRNCGNIVSAQAQCYRAEQTVSQVRNELTRSLADAFARYQASRTVVRAFSESALHDQVRAYRGIYERYRSDPGNVQFNDVVVAEQTLAATLTQYIDVLRDQWQAVVDLAELMQVNDIYTLGQTVPVALIPDLEAAPTPELSPPAP